MAPGILAKFAPTLPEVGAVTKSGLLTDFKAVESKPTTLPAASKPVNA